MTIRELPLVILAGVVLGILMGAVWSYPAMLISKCRDPYYTVLLGLSLGLTVSIVSFFLELPLQASITCFGVSVLLLGLRRLVGRLDHNFERFGMVHAFTLLLVVYASLFY